MQQYSFLNSEMFDLMIFMNFGFCKTLCVTSEIYMRMWRSGVHGLADVMQAHAGLVEV